jgi:cytokinin dehydrogenase
MSSEHHSRIGRRTFAKGAIGAAIVGLHVTSGRWVAADPRPFAPDVLRIPRLDGTLSFDAATLDEYAQDFGQIISERPLAVLRPGSVRDVSRMLRFAARHDIRVVNRGRAHTTYGQSQHPAAIVFDLTTFDHLGEIEGHRITVGAGVRWTDVLNHTLGSGLVPPVMPDYIGQTVGGTLSVGGIGAMSFRSGAQIDHVVSLMAVTGSGRIVECSEHRERELFEMLLAGQGQVGVIVEATLELVPAPSTVRLYEIVAPDVASLLADVTQLMGDQRFDQMEAFVIPTGPGEWLHLLQAIAHHRDGPPDDAALLGGLSVPAEQVGVSDLSFAAWSNRVGELPKQPHPWIDLIVPMSHAQTFVSEAQAQIVPVVAGDRSSILLIPMRTSLLRRPLFARPVEDFAVGFDTLRALPAGTDPSSVLAFNRRLYDRARDLGGKEYPISAVDLTPDDWAAHYGEQWERLLAAKRRFDPRDVLASGPDVLGRFA